MNNRPTANQTTPSSPPYTPSPPSTFSTPSMNTDSPSSVGHTATPPISLQSPPAIPNSPSAPSPPHSPSDPVSTSTSTTPLANSQIVTHVTPIVQPTTGAVQVTSSVASTQQMDLHASAATTDVQTSSVSSGQNQQEAFNNSTEAPVILAGAIPTHAISDATHLRQRISSSSNVTSPESDRTLRATTAPPTLASMSSQDSSSVEACAHSSTSRDSSDVLNWESSSSSTSSLNPGDQWELLPTKTEKSHYTTDHLAQD